MSSERRAGSAPGAWWDDGAYIFPHPVRQSLQLIDVDRAPQWTGLYNARGEKLFRLPEPFGFRR